MLNGVFKTHAKVIIKLWVWNFDSIV